MKQSININIHDGQQFSFYKNALGQIPFPSSIHPAPRDRATKIRKYQNHSANLQQRAEINRMRANSKNNPTYHGIGRHAGVKIGH
jgi:hypothetical protein